MSFPVDRLQHERPVHQDPVKVDRARDQTPVKGQLGVLLLQRVIRLCRIERETRRQRGRVVVNVPVDREDFLVDPVSVVFDDLPPRAAVFVRQAVLLEDARDPFEYSVEGLVAGKTITGGDLRYEAISGGHVYPIVPRIRS